MTIFHVEKRVTIGVMDWQRFSFDYRLRLEALTPGLIRIEASREAAVNLVLPPDWKTQLDRLNRVRAVHGTTALEGNPLSETEVGRQMDLLAASSTTPATTSRDQRQVQNAGRAQDWIRQRFTPTAAPLRRTDVLRMHELITEGADETDNLPGRLRTHSVVVGTEALGGVHRGAPPQEVSGLVDRFVEFVNSRPFMAQHPASGQSAGTDRTAMATQPAGRGRTWIEKAQLVLAHVAAVVIGFGLMVFGLGLGVTMVMLPVGLVVGVFGVGVFVWGLLGHLGKDE